MDRYFYRNEYYRALKTGNSKFKINYLNPPNKAISAVIGWHEEKDGYLDASVYKPFIRNKNDWHNIREANEWHLTNFMEPFLIKWGLMLNLNRFNKGWQKDLIQILKGKTGNRLQEFDNFKLINISERELQNKREKIVKSFEELKQVIKQTATSKLLHQLNPAFFPLWDGEIRKNTKKAYKNKYGNKIIYDTESADFYFEFMIIQREFIKKYNEILKKAGKYWYNKPLLRMSDRYFWILSNRAKSFIEY